MLCLSLLIINYVKRAPLCIVYHLFFCKLFTQNLINLGNLHASLHLSYFIRYKYSCLLYLLLVWYLLYLSMVIIIIFLNVDTLMYSLSLIFCKPFTNIIMLIMGQYCLVLMCKSRAVQVTGEMLHIQGVWKRSL